MTQILRGHTLTASQLNLPIANICFAYSIVQISEMELGRITGRVDQCLFVMMVPAPACCPTQLQLHLGDLYYAVCKTYIRYWQIELRSC